MIKTAARALVVSLATLSAPVHAGPANAPGKAPLAALGDSSAFDKIWSLATLYKNEANPILQKLALTGRYQGQYALMDSDQGRVDEWQNRRFRLGFDTLLLHDFQLKAEMQGDDKPDGEFYNGITDAYLAWRPDPAFNLILGKQKPRFSLSYSTLSRDIITIERDILINNFGIDFATGLSASGKTGNFAYVAGVFSNDTGETGGYSELGNLQAGFSYIASISYDLKDTFGLEKAILRGDYLHTDHDPDDELLTRFDNGLAASLSLQQGKLGLTTETIFGMGDAGDIQGLYLTPSYDITKKLQVVARYTYARSSDDALRLQGRYERKAPALTDGGLGGSYHAAYLGLNYYIYGHKAKLMTGVEYSQMDGGSDGGDFEGITGMGGIRLYW
jgi:phosphate-selective porin OprO and OprP